MRHLRTTDGREIEPVESPVIQGAIAKVNLPITLDDGSVITIVRRGLLPDQSTKSTPLRLLAVNNTTAPLFGPRKVNFTLAGEQLDFWVYEADIKEACLLGSDFHNHYKLRIDYATKTIRVQHPSVRTNPTLPFTLSEPRQPHKIVLYARSVRSCRVPAGIEQSIFVRTVGEIALPTAGDQSDQGRSSAATCTVPLSPCPPVPLSAHSPSVPQSPGTTSDPAKTVDPAESARRTPKNASEEFGLPAGTRGSLQGSFIEGLLVSVCPGFAGRDDMLVVRVWNINPSPIRIKEGAAVTCIALEPSRPPHLCPVRSVSTSHPDPDLPEPLVDLLNRAQLEDDGQRQALRELLVEYKSAFSCNGEIGRCDLVEIEIDTGNHPPIKMPPRRVPIHQQHIIDDCMDDMIELDAVEPAPESEWAFPVNLVPKKSVGKGTNSWRFAIDYRNLNKITTTKSYNLPRCDDTLIQLAGAKYFSGFDLKAGYWNIKVALKDQDKTSFCLPNTGKYSGVWRFKTMPFGLKNAPAKFQALMEKIMPKPDSVRPHCTCGKPAVTTPPLEPPAGPCPSTETEPTVPCTGEHGAQQRVIRRCPKALVYLDDIISAGATFDEALQNVREVLDALLKANLKISPKKTFLFQKRLKYLGHIVSEKGIECDPAKLEAVRSLGRPATKGTLRTFLGCCQYFHKHIKDLSITAAPLYKMTSTARHKSKDLQWTPETIAAFENLRERLVSPPVLSYPDLTGGRYIIDCDASSRGIGATLSQIQNGEERLLSYFSHALSPSEVNYCTTRIELLSILKALRQFHVYVAHAPKILIRTDHNSLEYIHNFKVISDPQLCRWLEEIEQYDYEIQYRPGKLHAPADFLSRLPARPCAEDCRHCNRMEIRQAEILQRDSESCAPCRRSQAGSTDASATQRDQESDPDLSPLLPGLQTGTRPLAKDIMHCSGATKTLWRQWDSLEYKDGIAYRKWEDPTGLNSCLQLLVPRKRVPEILDIYHDSPHSGGHFGINRTLAKIRAARLYWVRYVQDVRNWVNACLLCGSKQAGARKNRAPLNPRNAGVPWERLQIDFTGNFPCSRNGNRKLLLVQDAFTKFVVSIPVPTNNTRTVLQALITCVFTKFGMPVELHSDNATELNSCDFNDSMRLLGVRHIHSVSLAPHSNGLIEKFADTIVRKLSLLVEESQVNWDEFVDFLVLNYNATTHAVTGVSPAQMMSGREMHLPANLLLGTLPNSDLSAKPAEFVLNLQERLDRIHDVPRMNNREASLRMKKEYDIRAKKPELQAGESVWLYNPRRKAGRNPKLQRPWERCKFVGWINDVVCRVQPVDLKPRARKRFHIVHVDRLIKCKRPA